MESVCDTDGMDVVDGQQYTDLLAPANNSTRRTIFTFSQQSKE